MSANPESLPPREKELWQLADLRALGLGSRTTIWRLSKTDPTFPRPIGIRGLMRWRPDDVRAWLRSKGRAA